MVVIGFLMCFVGVGMIGFVVVQSFIDFYGYGGIVYKEMFGVWFDQFSNLVILD